MPTQQRFVRIDASAVSGQQVAAELALAFELGRGVVDQSPSVPRAEPAPLYRLVHYPDPRQPRAGASAQPGGLARPAPFDEARYVAVSTQDIKRLSRITHMLSSLVGELNSWLANMSRPSEEMEP